jgi:hypothetical protein
MKDGPRTWIDRLLRGLATGQWPAVCAGSRVKKITSSKKGRSKRYEIMDRMGNREPAPSTTGDMEFGFATCWVRASGRDMIPRWRRAVCDEKRRSSRDQETRFFGSAVGDPWHVTWRHVFHDPLCWFCALWKCRPPATADVGLTIG